MSIPGIPGLGHLPATQPAESLVRIVELKPGWEWRFEVAHGSDGIKLRLLHGTAERDGTELAANQTYTLVGTQSKILTWHGCTLEVEGPCEGRVAEHARADENPAVSHVNLHFALQSLRESAAGGSGKPAPRVLVCGPAHSGKTTLARTLVALATKQGAQAMLVNTDPSHGMLSLPGTVSAAVFASPMDVEDADGGIGVGSTPSSGPSVIPVKLPLVYYVGKERPEEDLGYWKKLVTTLARAASARLDEDAAARSAGLIIDSPPVADDAATETEFLSHVIQELEVNVMVILGPPWKTEELQKRYSKERTRSGHGITMVPLESSSGVPGRDEIFMQLSREATIKQYFFGDSKRTLSPLTQSVGFDEVAVYTRPDASDTHETQTLLQIDPSVDLSNCTLAVMNASPGDAPDVIGRASVLGFVYVADVDSSRRKLKVLAPVSGRLDSRPLVWGRWPEPFIGLVG